MFLSLQFYVVMGKYLMFLWVVFFFVFVCGGFFFFEEPWQAFHFIAFLMIMEISS